jgi:hypothetical protein
MLFNTPSSKTLKLSLELGENWKGSFLVNDVKQNERLSMQGKYILNMCHTLGNRTAVHSLGDT